MRWLMDLFSLSLAGCRYCNQCEKGGRTDSSRVKYVLRVRHLHPITGSSFRVPGTTSSHPPPSTTITQALSYSLSLKGKTPLHQPSSLSTARDTSSSRQREKGISPIQRNFLHHSSLLVGWTKGEVGPPTPHPNNNPIGLQVIKTSLSIC